MKLTKTQRILLESTYFDPSKAGSFMSAAKLHTALLRKQKNKPKKRGKPVAIPSVDAIKLWLQGKRAYTVHRPARKKYPMKQVIVSGVNTQVQADLIDMQQWASENDGFRYILIAIDCFSRFAYSRKLKKKEGLETSVAITSILDEAVKRCERKISALQVDQGTEFYNKHVKQIMKNRYVNLFSTKSPTKAQMVERLIRTLRGRQERYNSSKGKRRWIESFPKLVQSYNHSAHSSLPKGVVPADVNLRNESKIWKHLYGDTLLATPKSLQNKLSALSKGKALPVNQRVGKLKVGDPVRLSKRKRTFEKAFYQNFTDEIFFIAKVSLSTRPHTFRVVDFDGEILEGIFYRHELTPVRFEDNVNRIYAVESIVDEKIRQDGQKYLLVKWKGYSDAHNEWILADRLVPISKAT